MIDLHNHIINDLNPESVNWQEVLETARLAIGEGIAKIVWTPEIYSVNDLHKMNLFRAAIFQFKEKLEQNGYPLSVALGADLHMSTLDELICKRIREVIDTNYIVITLSPYSVPKNLFQIISMLTSQNLLPIIAHPEQYAWLEDKYELLYTLTEQGAWLQITSDSLLGMFGNQSEFWAYRMLDDGIVHVVASETHSLDYKPPLMGEAKMRVEKKVGKKEADNIFQKRAAALLNGQPLNTISVPRGVLRTWEKQEIIA